jgi:hypothetical protein
MAWPAFQKRGYMVCTSDYVANHYTNGGTRVMCEIAAFGIEESVGANYSASSGGPCQKKKRGYRVCSSGYAATDTS